MARRCTVCCHPAREAIDRAIIQGKALSTISRNFTGVSEDSLARHRDHGHIPLTCRNAHQQTERDRAGDHYQQICVLLDKAQEYMARAEGNGDIRVALQALREARSTLELLTSLQQATEPARPLIVKVLRGVSLEDL